MSVPPTIVIGWRIVQYDAVDSTQRVAAALVAVGVPGRTVIVAARQTAGIGRKGDPWRDLPGVSLLCTVILRPPWPRAAPIACYGMAAAVAVVGAIRDVVDAPNPPAPFPRGEGGDARQDRDDDLHGGAMRSAMLSGEAAIKWPNDVLLGGRKVAGILGDATWHGRQVDALRLGIGVNVGGTVAEFAAHGLPDATSIAAASGQIVTVEAVLSALLARLGAWDDALAVGDKAGVIAAWQGAVGTVGQAVRVTLTNGRELTGTAVGVTDGGDLLLAVPGERKPLTLSAGGVQSVRPAFVANDA